MRSGPALLWLGLAAATLTSCASGGGAGPATTSLTASPSSAAAAATAPSDALADTGTASLPSGPLATSAATSIRCLVRLHGKGGTGADPLQQEGVVELSPTGNADGWGARQWLYFPADRYAEARDVIAAAADAGGCTAMVVDGFSNGAAFAGELYCRGETFDGRLVGVIVDDPVPDHGSEGCTPAASVRIALYWTGGLDSQAKPGAACAPIDWTCDGGSMVGIDAYAAAMGATIAQSPNTTHEWYRDAPETVAWLAPS